MGCSSPCGFNLFGPQPPHACSGVLRRSASFRAAQPAHLRSGPRSSSDLLTGGVDEREASANCWLQRHNQLSLATHLTSMRCLDRLPGPLFRSESDRNVGAPLSIWVWSKIVHSWSIEARVPNFSTHSLRHLRLTHLARSGWKLHELTAYAGHRDPKTTMTYLHLSGGDLATRMAGAIAHIDSRVNAVLFQDGSVPYGTETLQQKSLFAPQSYPEANPLTSVQWEQLAKTSSVQLRKCFEAQAPALLYSLLVLAERSGIASRRTDGSMLTLLQEMESKRTTFESGTKRIGATSFQEVVVSALCSRCGVPFRGLTGTRDLCHGWNLR